MTDLIKHYRQLLGIAKTWAERNLAGWDDNAHRALLYKHGAAPIEGRVYASTMNMPQLAAALEDYEKRGWPRQRNFSDKANQVKKEIPSRIGTMVKLWGKLGQAGKLENANRHALLAFCARQTKRPVPNLDALSVKECQAITEALKSWVAR